jgi:Flp pilus assembly protein TadG
MTRTEKRIRYGKESGITLLLGTVSLLFIVPMIGLAVDVGFLYSVKAKLQAAVDGASLAAARALSIGASTASQASTAQANAVNWFNANFPSNYFGTQNTVMGTGNVIVQDDPTNSHLRDVTVTATTQVDTFFMKWLGFGATTIGATGNASRRDVVIMMIMDRSGSMNNNNGCANMRAAAKLFTGQFANNRDRIGMVEFGDTAWVDTSPVTNFQSVLGYSNNQGTGNGLIDTISCNDNTGTAQALSLGYNELYKMNLAGAFNILMFFTDGIPNTVTVSLKNNMLATSACKDSTGTKLSSGGSFVNHPPSWTPGWALGAGSYFANIPAGPIGAIAADDPNSTGSYGVRNYAGVSQSNTNHGTISSGNAPNCEFTNGATIAPGKGGEENYVDDFQTLPPTDIWGNNLINNSYNPVTTNAQGNVVLTSNPDNGNPLSGNNLTFHLVARNAADSAAYNARTNGTIAATIFGVGLGGTSQAPPGYDFMQRLTNDPNGDLYNSPALYLPCSQEPTCTTHSTQPQGTFIFATTPTQLPQVFLRMASQILRLSK